MSLKIIHTKNLRWIDIINPGADEIKYLKDNFNFHPLDFEDIIGTAQRPKIEDRDNYQFIVMQFPVYNRAAGLIVPGEVDFFVGKDFVVTIHDGSMHTMLHIVSNVHSKDLVRQEFMSKNSGYLLFKILESLFRRSFPMLDHISKDMNTIEKEIFDNLSLKMLEKISLMKRNIIDFRKIMKTHHLIVKRLINRKESYMIFAESKNYYINLLEHAENIWDILAIQKETIDALQEANQSLASNHLNEISKIIAIFSAVFLPASLILCIFGLSVEDLPFKNSPHGFWIILFIAGLSSLLAYRYFKRKKWF